MPPMFHLLTCFFFKASSDLLWAAVIAAGLYTVFVSPIDVENTWKFTAKKQIKIPGIWKRRNEFKKTKLSTANLLFQQELLIWQRNPNALSLTFWKKSTPKSSTKVMFIHTSSTFGQLCVKKNTSSAPATTPTWEATRESWEGSEFRVSRGPRRSLTDCFRDVTEGCCINKYISHMSSRSTNLYFLS